MNLICNNCGLIMKDKTECCIAPEINKLTPRNALRDLTAKVKTWVKYPSEGNISSSKERMVDAAEVYHEMLKEKKL